MREPNESDQLHASALEAMYAPLLKKSALAFAMSVNDLLAETAKLERMECALLIAKRMSEIVETDPHGTGSRCYAELRAIVDAIEARGAK